MRSRFQSILHFRPGLLGTFSLLSATAVVVLGVALATVLSGQIRTRSTDATVNGIAFATQVGLRQQILDHWGSGSLENAPLTQNLHDQGALKFARVRVWAAGHDGTPPHLVYTNSPNPKPAIAPDDDELAEALEGNVSHAVLHRSDSHTTEPENRSLLRRFGDLLEVYVPLYRNYAADGKPVGEPIGAFEVYMPDKGLVAAIGAANVKLYAALIIGLSLLYLLLYRLVSRASRRLKRHGQEMQTYVDRITYESEHDPLTDLPNRTLLHSRAAEAIEAAKLSGSRIALLLIDLDRFKEINDTLGHQSGDDLLREVGPRLEKQVPETVTVARFGGDEFGLLMTDVTDAAEAMRLARVVHKTLDRPFAVQSLTLDVEASIGVALYPDHAADYEELMQHADIAMYSAKRHRSGYELYEPSADDTDAARLQLAAELRSAVDRHELVLHYQPKVDLRSGRVTGAEALMRWHHPEHGLVMPDRFIPLAERSGLIRSLTVFAIDSALRECRRWIDRGIDLTVSVNLSTRDLIDVQLPDEVCRILDQHTVAATKLELEITESVLMADPVRARDVVTRLRDLGVKVSIDDFGSGYSSLGYLNQLAVNDLKIDKSFVLNMDADAGDAAIVQSTIDLAHNLGLEVVAEGVETRESYDRLRAMGCDTAQGYFISRPVPGAELLAFLAGASSQAA